MSEEKKKKIGPREAQMRALRDAEHERREAANRTAEKETKAAKKKKGKAA